MTEHKIPLSQPRSLLVAVSDMITLNTISETVFIYYR